MKDKVIRWGSALFVIAMGLFFIGGMLQVLAEEVREAPYVGIFCVALITFALTKMNK